MSHLIESQRDLNGRISRAFENLKKLGANNFTKVNVTARLTMLRKNWAKFEAQHDQLLAIKSDAEIRDDDYWEENEPSRTQEKFLEQEILLMEKLEELEKNERIVVRAMERLASGEGSSDQSSAMASRPTSTLPKIPLPTFSGKHKDWPSFQGLFRSLVIREPSLTDAQRLHYLRGALTGDAALLLRNIPEDEEHFTAAWELLQDRYENQRLMVKAQLNTIFGLPTLTRESGSELKRLFYTVCDTVKALAAIKRPFDASGDWLIHWIVERIDPQTRTEWEMLIGKTKTPPTFTDLQGFLEGRVNGLEALEEHRKANGNRIGKPAVVPRINKVHQVTTAKRTQEPCHLCKANHFILYCRDYKAKTVPERRATLKAGNLCYNCLGPSYYLPHHGVLKESSTTTRLRVVFNGSYSTTSGHSLNDVLMVGPNLLPNLQQLLFRWRSHRICLTADVEKMYRQILLHPDDRRYQRVLWRDDSDSEIRDYELNTVTYGLACAPFLAIRTLRQLAMDEKSRYPRAAAILLNDVYMDDVMTGADSVHDAAELQTELRQLCKAGGFNLRKWASNQPELMEELPTGDAIPECKWQTGETHIALGVLWSLADDCFRVRVQPTAMDHHITRRSVLSTIARIYDPLGLVSPVTVNAKIFMQSLWLLHLDWDAPLPPADAGYWKQFLDELTELKRIAVPRWLGLRRSSPTLELHGFADASERAYAAVVYIRVVNADGTIQTQLIAAKTKVAPLKRISLPRLELCAATLLTKLMALICTSLNLTEASVHLWSDSTITLAWIQGHPSRWKTYVANRVSEIQRTLPEAQWRHVPSQENPADCASRGLFPSQLPDFSLWWAGPAWLTASAGWTSADQPMLTPTDLEARTTSTVTSGEHATGEILLSRFSSAHFLFRVTAWCLRWLPGNLPGTQGPRLLPAEIEAARIHWLRLAQQQEFAADIAQLGKGRPLSNRSRLLRLTPYLDDQGLLRVGGRLRHSALPVDAQHQVVLPRDSRLTELLVVETHQRSLHGGTQLTLALLRQKYWIPQGRQRVKAIIHRCVTCARWRAATGQQIMGDLPAVRVTPARPFLHVGIDYAGPLTLLRSRGRGQRTQKGYVALFVCLSTRAVHLEVVSDSSTEAFLAALRRFTSRRGLCSVIQSDRGTNFVGAARELREMLAHLDSGHGTIHSTLLKDGIQWRFNPPAAPHFGGLWEAAVKSTKYHLKRVIGEQHLTYEEMSTLLHQIEACLNSRPLQAMSDDPGDLTTLTPGHFLIGDSLLSLPDPVIDDVPASRLSRWHLLQQMRLHFWKRWAAEYLQSLQARNKWTHQHPQPSVGDLCLIKTELNTPARWPLARVTRLHKGTDGLTRVVTVRTARSVFLRPITKLVFLPSAQVTDTTLTHNDSTTP